MKNDAQRLAKYLAKTVPATVGLKVAAMLSTMKSGFQSAIDDFVDDEVAIQALLNGYGNVPTIQYPFYLNFGREIRSRKYRGIDGAGLLSYASQLVVKYTSYGLDAAHLKAIALAVYTMVIP